MVPADTAESPHLYLSTFRTHVLDPVVTAEDRVEQERREIDDEREAFEEFATRVNEVPTVSGTVSPTPEAQMLADSPADGVELLQEAYEETVMDISHYETVYGESIGENLLAEYGPEFASLFDPSTGVSFTDYHRETLASATRVRIEERSRFDAVLEEEGESLRTAHRSLESTLDNFDSTVVPDWYHERFEAKIDGLLEVRQSEIDSQPPHSRLDGHDLCEYLYADEPWSYPVLTAVGRMLDAIVVRS